MTPLPGPVDEAEAASETARRVVDEGAALPVALEAESALALAWAFKHLCYAAWNTDPARTARAAQALRALATAAPAQSAPAVGALADWTEGIAALARGSMAEALSGLDRAAERFGALGMTLEAAQTRVARIVALSMLGRHDEATQCALAAQQAFVALGDRHAAGRVSLNLGTLHWRRGDYAQAARHSREAVLLFARVGDREHSVMADIGLADALTALGELDEAARIYARARMRASAHGLPVLEAVTQESAALLELARGHYREALAGLELARRGYERLGLAQQHAVAEKQLGDAYLELRLLPEALALLDEAARRFETLALADEQAWALVQRGRALALLGRAAPAVEALARADGLFAAQRNDIGTAAVALARAETALAADDAAAALEPAQRAAQAYADAGQAERHARANTLHARALLALGRVPQARAMLDASLAGARTLGLVPVELAALASLGRCALAEGREDEARAAFEAAVALHAARSAALPGDELRSAYLGEHLAPYASLLRLALAAHDRAPDGASALLAWHGLENHRARALGDRLAPGAARAQEPPPVVHTARARVQWLARRVEKLHDEGEPAQALEHTLHQAERELLEQARRARLADAAPGSAGAAHDAPALASPQAWLPPGTALVEYGALDDELFAFVFAEGGTHLVRRIAPWSEACDAVRALRFQLESLRHGAAPVQSHLARLEERSRARLQRLHGLVWAPLAPALRGARRVLVVPQGALAAVPFAALHDGTAWLGDGLELALAPSARAAQHTLPAQPAPANRALALGLSRELAHAEAEVRQVAGLLPGATCLLDGAATIPALRAHAAGAGLVHFACHARFRADNPMFSALYLHDGPLDAAGAESLPLDGALVVLGACETGLAAEVPGDEMFGLVRAFFVAGAARVLASLWPVDDAATAAFMGAFYRALAAGAAPAQALQQAQGRVRADRPHPAHWAGFVLFGGF